MSCIFLFTPNDVIASFWKNYDSVNIPNVEDTDLPQEYQIHQAIDVSDIKRKLNLK